MDMQPTGTYALFAGVGALLGVMHYTIHAGAAAKRNPAGLRAFQLVGMGQKRLRSSGWRGLAALVIIALLTALSGLISQYWTERMTGPEIVNLLIATAVHTPIIGTTVYLGHRLFLTDDPLLRSDRAARNGWLNLLIRYGLITLVISLVTQFLIGLFSSMEPQTGSQWAMNPLVVAIMGLMLVLASLLPAKLTFVFPAAVLGRNV